MRISVPGGGGAGSDSTARAALMPQGLLTVPGTYVQTAGDQAVQLDSANDWIASKIVPKTDWELTALSLYITAVATEGVFDLSIYSDDGAADSSPDSSLASFATDIGSGDSADTWLRTAGTAYQLQRGKPVWIVAKGKEGDDYSFSTRRWNTNAGSMFPDEMPVSKYTTDGGNSWSECQQGSKPALWNIVLNSSANHVPPLIYGRHNGKYIYCPGDGVKIIPEAGISYACDALTADTLYYEYVYDDGGTMKLDPSTTPPTLSEGILVKTGATTRRLVGLIYPKELQSGYQGPVDVMDMRLVLNQYNKIPKRVGKLMPYAISGDTVDNNLSTSWESWNLNGDDYKICFLSDGINPVKISAQANCHQKPLIAIGVDEKLPHRECTIAYYQNTSGYDVSMAAELKAVLSPGYHYVYPLQAESSGHGSMTFCALVAGFQPTTEVARSQVLGTIRC